MTEWLYILVGFIGGCAVTYVVITARGDWRVYMRGYWHGRKIEREIQGETRCV